MSNLVSILTPTYNCGKFIRRLLDSVLMQTYPEIEMHVMDDGSKDDTREIVERYMPEFEKKGYRLHYHYQDNQGQSGAINNGLKLVNGRFLAWPDADDYYKTADAVECLVRALETADEHTAMSRCLTEYLNEEDLSYCREIKTAGVGKEELFEDCLFGTNGFWYNPGGYMVKFEALRQMIPELEIYTDRAAGQNWQLMLPILYRYKCITVPLVKYSVLIRRASHSRSQFASRRRTNRLYNVYRTTILETLKRIPSMPAREQREYSRKVNAHYNRLIFRNNMLFILGPLVPTLQRIKRRMKG